MKNVDYDDNNDEDNEKDLLDNFALIFRAESKQTV